MYHKRKLRCARPSELRLTGSEAGTLDVLRVLHADRDARVVDDVIHPESDDGMAGRDHDVVGEVGIPRSPDGRSQDGDVTRRADGRGGQLELGHGETGNLPQAKLAAT